MYIPKPFVVAQAQSLAFVKRHPFASVTTSNPLQATHVPLSIIERAPDKIVLEGHVAKANPHHKCFDEREVLCIFTGPHAYISGTDYEKGPAVPTWNYTSVHMTGAIQSLSADENLAAVKRILALYEGSNSAREDIYEGQYIEKLSKAIVCFEIAVNTIEGKFKLGQQRSQADQDKTLNRLQHSDSYEDLALAHFIRTQQQ